MDNYYDRDGDLYQAASANAAADEAYGVSNHDDQSMWSVDADYGWIEHVLGSGSADIQVSKDDLPFSEVVRIDLTGSVPAQPEVS